MRETSSGHRPDFIGRAEELETLHGVLRDARAGHARFVLLVGSAGIGKTRMAEAVAAIARARGFHVLWGGCHEREGTPPYWPWVQALRDQLRPSTSPAPGDGAAALTELLPHPAGEGAGWEPAGTGPAAASEQFRMFDAVGTVLRQATEQGPVLLVLDDLHWADDSSLLLLEFIVRELASTSMVVLGTCREAEPTGRRSVVELLKRVPARTIPLRGLDRPAVRRLMTDALGRPPSDDVVRRVRDLTEGNPFFVIELASWMASSASADREGEAALELPHSILAVTARRLDGLSAAARRVARMGAVVGREFDATLIRAVEGPEAAPVSEALEEAVAAHVLVPTGTGYRFRHAMIRRALYEELSPARRIEAHAAVAGVLERRPSGPGPSDAAALAHHYTRAEPLVGPAKVIEYSRAAASHAMATHAYEEAVRHYRRALERKERGPADAELATILSGLGRARAASSPRWNRQEAWNHLRRAAEHYLAEGAVDRAVAEVTHPGITPEGAQGVARTVERVLERVTPESREAGWLWARHAAALYFETGDYERARASFVRALSIAHRMGDPGLELRTLAYAIAVDHFDSRWQAVLTKGRRAMELARRIDDAQAESYAGYRISFALAFVGRADEAELEARANLQRAESRHDRGLLEDALWINAVLAQLRGQWELARALIDRGLGVSPGHLPLLHIRVLLEYELGEAPEGKRFLQRLLAAADHAGPYPLRGVFCALALPQVAGLAQGAAVPEARVLPAGSVPVARTLLAAARALAAVQAGDAEAAAREAAVLGAARGTIAAPLMVTDRLLGQVAQLGGDRERAERHFEEALTFCRGAGYTPELAWTCHDYARLLLAAGGGEPRARARRLLDEARELSARLGMGPLGTRIAALSDGAGSTDLTPRELDVLRLLASGRTNREIGEALFISDNTVAVHVAHILEKTSTRNRTEAASYAIRAQLVEPER